MYENIENKTVSKLIFSNHILTLLIKKNHTDEYANGSINFVGTVYFYETGIINQTIKIFNQGLLGFTSRNYVIKNNLEPNDFIQFYIDAQDNINSKQKLELIVVCKSIEISDNPYLFLPQ